MIWIILGGIIGLIVQLVIASKFADLAEDKGYDRTPYFWLCFLLGAIGYCMVASLTDIRLHNKLDKIAKQITSTAIPSESTSTAIPSESKTKDNKVEYVNHGPALSAMWACKKCGTHNSKSYGQCKKCGTYRS